MATRVRRTKNEVINAKIVAIDEKIANYQNKIAELEAQKEEIQAEASAAEEKKIIEGIMQLVKENGLSIEEIKELISK